MDKKLRINIKNQVYRSVKKFLDKSAIDEFELRFERMLENFNKRANFIEKRLIDIESMIHNHAIGVQNVYEKVDKIEKTLELKDIKQLVRYIESYDSKRIKTEIEEIHKYMNSDHVTNAIAEFQDFKYNLIELLDFKLK